MTFHPIRLPVDIERGALGGPGFKTAVTPLGSGKEQRNIDWARTRGEWDIGYGLMQQNSVVLEATIDVLLSFFYAREGRAHTFLFKDWSDFKVGDYLNPTTSNQQIGVGNASDVTFQAYKRYSSGGIDYDRPLTHPVNGRVKVLLDDVVQTEGVDYTISYTTGIITFIAGAPGNGVLVQIALEFDVPVRFNTDRLNLNLTMFERGSWPNIEIVEDKQ